MCLFPHVWNTALSAFPVIIESALDTLLSILVKKNSKKLLMIKLKFHEQIVVAKKLNYFHFYKPKSSLKSNQTREEETLLQIQGN